MKRNERKILNTKLPSVLKNPVKIPAYIARDSKLQEDFINFMIPKQVVELKKFYHISPEHPDSWCYLAIQLAMQFIPGFRFETRQRKGRQPKWNDFILYCLDRRISEELGKAKQIKTKKKIEVICTDLVKERFWKALTKNSETLRQRYYDWPKAIASYGEYAERYIKYCDPYYPDTLPTVK